MLWSAVQGDVPLDIFIGLMCIIDQCELHARAGGVRYWNGKERTFHAGRPSISRSHAQIDKTDIIVRIGAISEGSGGGCPTINDGWSGRPISSNKSRCSQTDTRCGKIPYGDDSA